MKKKTTNTLRKTFTSETEGEMIKEHQMIKWREQNERVNKTVDDALNKLLKLTEN